MLTESQARLVANIQVVAALLTGGTILCSDTSLIQATVMGTTSLLLAHDCPRHVRFAVSRNHMIAACLAFGAAQGAFVGAVSHVLLDPQYGALVNKVGPADASPR